MMNQVISKCGFHLLAAILATSILSSENSLYAEQAMTQQAKKVDAQSAQWIHVIHQRALQFLLPDTSISKQELASASKHAKALQADGSWADIDYNSKQRSLWPTAGHIQRILTMARGYHLSRESGKPDAALLASIHSALDNWIVTDRKCPNWWWNEIGAPQTLGYIMLVLGPDADPAQKASVIEIMKRSNWSKWTGQNLVWGTGIQIHRGLLEQNAKVIRDAYDRTYQEIRVAPLAEEGIMPDASFHQHGKQLYSGGYGLGFTNDIGRLIYCSWNTPAQISAEKLNVYLGYLLDGQRWMIYRNIFDYSAVGRELTRKGKSAFPYQFTASNQDKNEPIRMLSSGIHTITPLLAGLKDISRQKELVDFAAVLRHAPNATPIVGNKHFWCSDYMVHRTAESMFSIRMFSTRTQNTEEVNSENRKGHHLADGATYIYRTGQEYRDIFPTWNWDKIPGTTAEQSDKGNDPNSVLPNGHHVKGKTSFVGGVSDGHIGLAAMDLQRGNLTARKTWACVDDIVVCIGAAISCESPREVMTTINQSLHHGEVQRTVHDSGSTYVWHDNIGYIIAPGQKVALMTAERTGKWSDIGVSPLPPISNTLFTLGIQHEAGPKNAAYQYVVLPNITREDFARRAESLDVKVVQNDSAAQAIHVGQNLLITFWQAGEVTDGDLHVRVDQPCLLLVRNKPRTANGGESFAVSASNPNNQALAVNVNIRSATCTQSLRFNLPGGPLAGSTSTLIAGR